MRSTQVSNNKRRSNNKFNQKSISKNIINTLEKKNNRLFNSSKQKEILIFFFKKNMDYNQIKILFMIINNIYLFLLLFYSFFYLIRFNKIFLFEYLNLN